MSKILFLDCDGTIREPKSGAKFISNPEDQQIIKGADDAIARSAVPEAIAYCNYTWIMP